MAQKIVSYNVAKALKEAGYWNPGTTIKCSYNNGCYIDDGRFYEDGCVCPWDRLYPAPTYIETWLWLWRKKRVGVSVDYYRDKDIWESDAVPFTELIFFDSCADPEEAIAKAIDFLVENDLIK